MRKKHGKNSVRVAARTSQADSTVHRRKTVTQSSRIYRTIKNTEYTKGIKKTIHYR
jgi:hypothetical protein